MWLNSDVRNSVDQNHPGLIRAITWQRCTETEYIQSNDEINTFGSISILLEHCHLLSISSSYKSQHRLWKVPFLTIINGMHLMEYYSVVAGVGLPPTINSPHLISQFTGSTCCQIQYQVMITKLSKNPSTSTAASADIVLFLILIYNYQPDVAYFE